MSEQMVTLSKNILPEQRHVASLPRCTAEAKRNFRFEHDAATNTSRQVFIPPTDDQRYALLNVAENLEARLVRSKPGICTALLEGLKHMPRQKGTVDDWDMFFHQAEFDLGGFSASHLKEAVDEYRQSARFYPTIADIRKICERLREEDERRLRRAKLALYGPHKNDECPEERVNVRTSRPQDFRTVLQGLSSPVGVAGECDAPISAKRAAELRMAVLRRGFVRN